MTIPATDVRDMLSAMRRVELFNYVRNTFPSIAREITWQTTSEEIVNHVVAYTEESKYRSAARNIQMNHPNVYHTARKMYTERGDSIAAIALQLGYEAGTVKAIVQDLNQDKFKRQFREEELSLFPINELRNLAIGLGVSSVANVSIKSLVTNILDIEFRDEKAKEIERAYLEAWKSGPADRDISQMTAEQLIDEVFVDFVKRPHINSRSSTLETYDITLRMSVERNELFHSRRTLLINILQELDDTLDSIRNAYYDNDAGVAIQLIQDLFISNIKNSEDTLDFDNLEG